jgi:putative membrane protein
MMWGYGVEWLSMILMSFGMVLWIALLVVLVWAIIRWIERKTTTQSSSVNSSPPNGPTALELLQQRYARGEIDTATYEQMRERLEATPTYQPGNQPMTSSR